MKLFKESVCYSLLKLTLWNINKQKVKTNLPMTCLIKMILAEMHGTSKTLSTHFYAKRKPALS